MHKSRFSKFDIHIPFMIDMCIVQLRDCEVISWRYSPAGSCSVCPDDISTRAVFCPGCSGIVILPLVQGDVAVVVVAMLVIRVVVDVVRRVVVVGVDVCVVGVVVVAGVVVGVVVVMDVGIDVVCSNPANENVEC